MQRMKFSKDFVYEHRSPRGALLWQQEYKAGQVHNVTEAQRELIDAAGVAEVYQDEDEGESTDGPKSRRRKSA